MSYDDVLFLCKKCHHSLYEHSFKKDKAVCWYKQCGCTLEFDREKNFPNSYFDRLSKKNDVLLIKIHETLGNLYLNPDHGAVEFNSTSSTPIDSGDMENPGN